MRARFYQVVLLRRQRPIGFGIWIGIILASYMAGNSYSGLDRSFAATDTAAVIPVAVATPLATPTPAPPTPMPTPVPTATPAPPPAPALVPTPATAPVRLVAARVSTTNTYSYGFCTYYVATRRAVGPFWGNAINWFYRAQNDGYRVGSSPVPGAIAWTSIGTGGQGHVAIVEQVAGGQIYISEMNFNGNWNRVTYRWATAANFRYIY